MSDDEKKSEVVEKTTAETKIGKENSSDTVKKDALVTCRILFISVLDKIYIVCLLLILLVSTYVNFRGDMTSLSYGFWSRLLSEIIIIIGVVITYFICNWLYKCYAKTMLCVTDKEIYKEKYLPFKRSETTIPLNKVTSITAFKFFWIFRSVIIFQYHHMPMVFFTWNNQEFKDKVEELLVNDKTKVNNQFESKNIINKEQYKYVAIVGAGLAVIIAILGIVRFFGYMFSEERTMPGTYSYEDKSIVLNNDGTCKLDIGKSDITSCNWSYDNEVKKVTIDYKYEYKYSSYYSYYSYSNEMSDSIVAEYNNKTLTYNNTEYKKN